MLFYRITSVLIDVVFQGQQESYLFVCYIAFIAQTVLLFSLTLTSNNASSGSWTGMLKYPKNTTNGDSGALIIIGNYAYGIHRGGGSYSIDYQNAFATPSSTVLSLLGLTN